jgi:glycosyltransferase involved in cell wall biosynthesis
VRDDIRRLVPDVDPARIRVTPFGVGDVFRPRPAAEVADVLARLRVPTPYVLFTGNLDPRKNVTALVEAYARLRDGGDRPEHLVLAGHPGWSVDALEPRLRDPRLRGRVHRLGWVPEADLPALYAGARLFVFPSLLEGFGFPPLEAMASGVPVVASRGSSLGEHLEGAAELVDPRDVGALATAMRRLLTDEDLRRERIEAGLARAGRFRWDAFGSAMRDCYVAAAAGRPF